MVIQSVITPQDASRADGQAKERHGVLVYRVETEDNKAAVAKIPPNPPLYDQEVR